MKICAILKNRLKDILIMTKENKGKMYEVGNLMGN